MHTAAAELWVSELNIKLQTLFDTREKIIFSVRPLPVLLVQRERSGLILFYVWVHELFYVWVHEPMSTLCVPNRSSIRCADF